MPGDSLQTGQQIYDAIMSTIEPELTSQNLMAMKAANAQETPTQRSVRMARYARAFAEYDKVYAQYKAKVEEQVAQAGRLARTASEEHQLLHESRAQDTLLSQIALA